MSEQFDPELNPAPVADPPAPDPALETDPAEEAKRTVRQPSAPAAPIRLWKRREKPVQEPKNEKPVKEKPKKAPKQPKAPRQPKQFKGQKRESKPLFSENPLEQIPQYTRAVWSHLEQIPNQKGLRRRWLLNTVGVLIAVSLVITVLLSMFISNYYYSGMRASLESSAQEITHFISAYATNETSYLEMAEKYVSEFKDADKLNLQFLSTRGTVLKTSYAISGDRPGTSDIETAVGSGEVACFIGKNPSTGERIMAVSSPIINSGQVRGIMRLVTSCSRVDRQILLMCCVVVLVAAAMIVLMYFFSLFFIQSIIVPVNSITQTAQRIAAGSYGIQIEKKNEDEIGDLVDAINDMSHKISESERTKNEFISSVSHELRTPLTAINGWSQTLVSGEITDAEYQRKGLSIIVSESQRLAKMVEELLDFSRIEDGRFTLNIEPIDIKAEFEDAVFTYQQFFREKNIRLIHHDCDDEFPPIPGDPARLRQVFSNVLDNAGKYGFKGSKVETFIDRDDGMVRIRIRDYGDGIPEKDVGHVKEKFYRASATSTAIRGNGIGLSVCDEIITRLGGRLTIGNAEGGGCLVTLHLPMTTPTVAPVTLRESIQEQIETIRNS